jgi:hypothetical protein
MVRQGVLYGGIGRFENDTILVVGFLGEYIIRDFNKSLWKGSFIFLVLRNLEM